MRVLHWAQAALIAVAWLTEDGPKTLHQTAGYLIAGMLALRVVWGVVGSRGLGQNPSGGAMGVELMLTVAGIALMG